MALDRIDLTMHRPHPPGYLGYVFAARALRQLLPDANTALVVWNIIATTLAVIVIAWFAFDVSDPVRRRRTAIGASVIVATSPLVWLYGEVAEIYASELLFAAIIGYAVARAARGNDRAMYAAVAALAVTAAFKVVTAFLMFPAVVYAWTRVSPAARKHSVTLIALAAVIVLGLFVIVQPDLWTVAARLIRSSGWLVWNPETNRDNVLRLLNRNFRNTLTASILAIGLVNMLALVVWALRDRHLPAGFDRRVAWAWLLPILLFCIVVLIAKPGYVLPFVPLAAVVIAGFYARLTPAAATTLVALQAFVNVAHFLLVSPLPASVTGGAARYRDKPVWQRLASDLQPLTFPTRFTIAASDRRVDELMALVATTCPNRQPVIIADTEPVDWRRVMFYVPEGTAIHANATGFDFIGHETDFRSLPNDGLDITTRCPVIWLAPDEGPGGVVRSAEPAGQTVPHLGWTTPPGSLTVGPSGSKYRNTP